jgi:holo-[acyl-carrier protein] synthase
VGAERCGWKQVVVDVEKGGRVGAVVRQRRGEGEGRIARGSISHDGQYVIAVVMAAEEEVEDNAGHER